MNQNRKAQWEIIRAKGMWRYVLVQWLFKVILPVFLVLSLAQYFGLFNAKAELKEWLFTIPFFLIGGVFIGVLAWGWNESMYK